MTRFTWQTEDGWTAPPMVSKHVGARVNRGQRVRLETPGGGGYGDVGARSKAAHARDRALGYVTGSEA